MRNMRFVTFSMFLIGSCLFSQNGGNSLDFDGFNDWVNCGTKNLNITDSLTIEAWVKAGQNQPAGYSRILDKFNYFAQEGFNLVTEFYSSGGSVMLDFWGTDGSKNSLVGISKVNNDQWYHVTAVYDGNEMKVYINGLLETQNVIGAKTIKASSNYLGIGNNFDGATWFPFKGQVDEIRLWNTWLDSITINEWLYKRLNTKHPKSSNLVGYWMFNEGFGSTTGDSSTYANHGSLMNMDTTNAWQLSTAPLATGLTDTLSDLAAVWVSNDSAGSSILSLQSKAISTDESVIFGHNGSSLIMDSTDVPVNFGIYQRLSRIWRLEVYGQPVGDLIFTVHDFGISNGGALRLLIDEDGLFANADSAEGFFNTNNSTFTVFNRAFKHGYFYTLGTADGPVSSITDLDVILPEKFVLFQNIPNPFNPTTTIYYELPKSAKVVLKIYNILGQEIRTLVNENQSSGKKSISWNGRDHLGNSMSSGVYIYMIKAGDYWKARKMLLLQ